MQPGETTPETRHSRAATGLPWRLVAAVGLAFLGLGEAQAQANLPVDAFWVTDGDVDAVAEQGGVVYLGGGFSYVGPPTGSMALLDAATGAANLSFPRVEGEVLTAAPDGAGGVYIGGTFTSVGGLARQSVAQVLADGRVSSWDPNPPAGSVVQTLAVSGNLVYVGGTFTDVGGQPRSNLAAVDAASGIATSWDPSANSTVYSIVVAGTVVYAGGAFSTVSSQSRSRIAALDPGSGAATAWDPDASSTVYAMALSGSTLYVGGNFTSVGGQSRNRIAALRTSDGTATSWNPSASSLVGDLLVAGTTVYAAGLFTSIGGQARSYLAALDATIDTNNATTWDPAPDQMVRAFSLVGTTLYTGGAFTMIGGQPRARIAAIDTTTDTNNATAWNPGANGDVSAVAASATVVWAAGEFSSAGGVVRDRLAALDGSTGVPTAWNPGADGAVMELLVSGGRVFVGGHFLTIGGQPRDRIGALDQVSGAAIAGWDPGTNHVVLALDLAGGTLFGGGLFGMAGGQSRLNLAGFDEATGALAPWHPVPSVTSQVGALQVDGTSVYAGGWFDYAGRNRIVELDRATAAPTSWNPGASDYVHALAITPSLVYAGGDFGTIGGASRSGLAALDRGADTNNATSWNPGVVGSVYALIIDGDSLFVGGTFSSVAGAGRTRLASFHELSGTLNPWSPSVDGFAVSDLAVGGGKILAGGSFDSIGGRGRPGFAAFCLAAAPTGLSATPAGPNQIDLTWNPTSAPSYNVYRARDIVGPYSLVGNAAGPTHSDTTAEGGITYHYVVRGVESCESDPSAAASASTSGSCALAPDFDGVGWVQQLSAGTCGIELGWAPGYDPCGGTVSYSVYRDTAPAFTPSIANLIATVPSASTYTDSSALSPGTPYHYLVRATGQPSGTEDSNLIERSVVPAACTVGGTDTVSFLTVTSRNTENVLEWVNPVGSDTVSIHATSGASCTPPTDPLSGTTWLADRTDPDGIGDRDRFQDTGLTPETRYCYSVFVDTGTAYSAGRSNVGRPPDTSKGVKWAFSTGVFAYTAPTVGGAGVIAIANDHVLHAMERGAAGGEWPAGWLPVQLGDKVEGRSPIVPIDVGGHNPVVFLGSYDGNVYAVNGALGGAAPLPWSPSFVASDINAAPAGIFSDFGGAFDYLLVGSRNTTGDNYLAALDPATGTILSSFDNGGGLGNRIGIISRMPSVDYSTGRVYFTSWEGVSGSMATLWALQLGTSPVFTQAWATQRPLGKITSSPVLMGDRVYVGNDGGTVYSIDAASGASLLDRTLLLGDGPVRGFMFPDRAANDLYFATNSFVWGVHDDGAALSDKFGGGLVLDSGVTPTSPVLFVPGSHYVYVGGSNGKLYEVDTLGPGIRSVQLGEATPRTVGAPSFDSTHNLIHVGTEDGAFYAVEIPLP